MKLGVRLNSGMSTCMNRWVSNQKRMWKLWRLPVLLCYCLGLHLCCVFVCCNRSLCDINIATLKPVINSTVSNWSIDPWRHLSLPRRAVSSVVLACKRSETVSRMINNSFVHVFFLCQMWFATQECAVHTVRLKHSNWLNGAKVNKSIFLLSKRVQKKSQLNPKFKWT